MLIEHNWKHERTLSPLLS